MFVFRIYVALSALLACLWSLHFWPCLTNPVRFADLQKFESRLTRSRLSPPGFSLRLICLTRSIGLPLFRYTFLLRVISYFLYILLESSSLMKFTSLTINHVYFLFFKESLIAISFRL